MIATAVQLRPVEPTRLEKPPRGPHKREAFYVRAVFAHQKALRGGTLTQRAFAELVGVSKPAVDKWFDGLGRLRSDSLAKLAQHAPPNLRPPLSALTDGPSDSVDLDERRAYDPQGTSNRGYAVRTDEGAILARWIDRITDEEERAKALASCIRELSANPRGVVAEKRPDRPTQGKP